LVRYSTESRTREASTFGRASKEDKRTILPPGESNAGALASHSSGGNVAREVATAKPEAAQFSILERTTVVPTHLHSLTAVLRKAIRFARGSKSVTRQSGLIIEKGIAGRPPPEPTSTTSEPGGTKRETAKLSGK
jgi:hypothetical protein